MSKKVEFKFDGLTSNTPVNITAVAVDRTGNRSPVSVNLPASTQAHSAEDPLTDADKAIVSAVITGSMAHSKQPGVLFAISGPRGHHVVAQGVTAGNTSRPVTIDDHYRIASTTKSFTAWAFWRQWDQGRIHLDDKLEQFVPGIPNGNIITMRHLMQMRSGVYDYASNPLVQIIFTLFPTWGWTDTESDCMQFFKQPSTFAPGSKYQYTNSNTVLLGICIRMVDPAHRHIRDIIQQDLITPLGLTETTWPRNSVIPAPAAGTSQINPELFGCAGALTSTVGDQLKWAQELRDHTLISQAAWETWTDLNNFWGYAAPFPTPPPNQFGYGLFCESTGRTFGHNGVIAGWATNAAFDKTTGACIAVCDNALTSDPVAAAYTTITHDVMAQLYPGSMNDQVYPQPPEATT